MKSIRLTFLLIFLFQFAESRTRTFSFPDIRESGKAIGDFVPKDWSVLDSVSGDLNHDGFMDMAMVIEYDDSVNEVRPDGVNKLDQPRILLVLLRNASGSYTLSVQDNSFLLRTGEAGMKYGDPYEKLSIEGDTLSIDFMRTRGHLTYDFILKDEDLLLIGAGNSFVSSTGMIDDWEFDFISKKSLHTLGTISEKDIYEVRKTIPFEQLKSLDDLKMPMMWEVFDHVFI